MYALIHNWDSINLPVGTEIILLQRLLLDSYVWEDIINPTSIEPFPAAYIKAFPTSPLRLLGKFIIIHIEEDKKAVLKKSVWNSLNAIFVKPEPPPAPKPFTRIELKSIKNYLYQGKSPIEVDTQDEEDGIYRRLHKRELYAFLTGEWGAHLAEMMYLGDDNLKLVQHQDLVDEIQGYWRDFLFPAEMTSEELSEQGCRRCFGTYNTLLEFGDEYAVVLEPVKMEIRELKEPKD